MLIACRNCKVFVSLQHTNRARPNGTQKRENMKLKCVMMSLAVLVLTSCSTKMSAVNDLRHFNDRLEKHGTEYSIAEWKEAAADFREINDKINKHRDKYTTEERKEIGQLKGESIALFGKSVASSAITRIAGAASELKGLIDGLKNIFND